jgi:CubicO group peptidase (beta-lactamase class C family)
MVDLEHFREPQRHVAHVVVDAPNPQPWPERLVPLAALDCPIVGAGQAMDLAGFLAMTSTTAFVVVVDGVLVYESYATGVSATDRLLGNSATKSALAHLVGVAVGEGSLADLDADLCAYVPELVGSGYDGVTVRQVLTMTSGLDWVEDYHDPAGQATQFINRWRQQLGGSRDALAALRPGDPPGSRYTYCSPDSMVLDWVRERASGQTYPAALASLWAALGAEHPAVVGLDGPTEVGGVALAAGALGASARDWARIGGLQIDGTWNGTRLLDASWVDASSRPELPFLRPGRLPSRITTHAGFGYHWWPLDDDGQQVMADGMQGQFVYVDRPTRTVVVKTSAWPYEDPWWDRQCRDLSYLALPAIADAAQSSSRPPGT